MMPQHDLAIQQFHQHFKANGQVVFRQCTRDTLRPSLHRVAFDMKDAAGNTLLHLTLEMELDEAQLRAELSTVDPEARLNILDNKDRMDGFMEASGFELIRYLRSYNGVADDHEAIAQLVYGVRGPVRAKEFNL